MKITEPGVYDLTHAEYLADPVEGGSLSSSGARRLLPPSCPAKFDYWRTHAEPPKEDYELGHAAHDAVLGSGPEIVVVEAEDWRTKAAREQRDDARTRGAVPMLRDQWRQVLAMRDAVLSHPFAGRLFTPGSGTPETSLVWHDDEPGIWRRARLDWLRYSTGSRLVVPDLKTANSANPGEFARQAANLGYHQQAAWYLDAVRALGLGGDDAVFVFVVVEKTPPYLVSVIQLDVVAMRMGRALNQQAIRIYADCTRSGIWHSYTHDVALVSLPGWYERQHEEDAA